MIMETKEINKTIKRYLFIKIIKCILSPLLGMITGTIIGRFLFHIDWAILLTAQSFLFGAFIGSIIGCLLAYNQVKHERDQYSRRGSERDSAS